MKLKKILRVTGKVIMTFLVILICSLLILSVVHNILKEKERAQIKAPGTLVEVNGSKMHVAIRGEGKDTIVLLTGLGTVSPYLDFEPLVKSLENSYKVVVIEPFGYGFSDMTNRPRTVENITEEIHTALQKAGVKSPYILMPHSVSGIYGLYYLNRYANEVKAFIGMDPTLPRQCVYFNETVPKAPQFLQYLSSLGITRIAVNVKEDNFLPIAEKGTYTKDNLKLTKVLSSWNIYNRNILWEMNEMTNNMEKSIKLEFPKDLPVLIFMKESLRTTDDGKTLKSFYETYIKKLNKKEISILKGHHYLHWTNSKIMKEKIELFLNK